MKRGFQSTLKAIDNLQTAEYYFENGLRKVRPYYFTFQTFAKRRWLGRTILDIFGKEFVDRKQDYYREAIRRGMITINGEATSPDTTIHEHDLVEHRIHRHEPPVSSDPITIMNRHDDLLIVNKPGGLPVHPSGRFRHNTVTHILRKEQIHCPIIHPINRLDRLTSGLVLLALSPERAQALNTAMVQRNVQKEYLCRVLGRFPSSLSCNAPIRSLAPQISLLYVHDQGKPCHTLFRRISYDGETSIVHCIPVTGRTHQIRIHLKYLGWPIVDDPLYGPSTQWAPWQSVGRTMTQEETTATIEAMLKNIRYPTTDHTCSECHTELDRDPTPSELVLSLHAWRYRGDFGEFETPLPAWARTRVPYTMST